MVLKQKNRYKPLYKQFLRLRDNIQDKKKLLKFKKKKWQSFIQNYKRKLKRYNKFNRITQIDILFQNIPVGSVLTEKGLEQLY